MKKKITFIFLIILLGCFYVGDTQCLHKKEIDQINLKKNQKLVIVAHPDDEMIWGGSHLFEGNYLVVCLTNGNNNIRKKEFIKIMEKTHNKGLIFNYPDLINGKKDQWINAKKEIEKDIAYIIKRKNWKMVITHNPKGEYGHIHHRLTSQIVSLKCSYKNLYYFGKYYKRKHIPVDLKKIDKENYDLKMKLIKRYYPSQKGAVKLFIHMISYENFVKAKDWISLQK